MAAADDADAAADFRHFAPAFDAAAADTMLMFSCHARYAMLMLCHAVRAHAADVAAA